MRLAETKGINGEGILPKDKTKRKEFEVDVVWSCRSVVFEYRRPKSCRIRGFGAALKSPRSLVPKRRIGAAARHWSCDG